MAGLFVFIAAGAPVKAGILTAVLWRVVAIEKMKLADAKMRLAKADMMALGNCLAMYELNAGVYPTTEQGLKALVDRPIAPPIPRRWARILDKMLVDPWGHPYQYQFPGAKDPAKYELFSLGPDGVADTADDVRGDG